MKKLLMLIVLCIGINAGDGWKDKEGNLVKETPWMKSKGDFGVTLFIVNEKEFFKVWNKPSQSVNIDIVEKIHKGDEVIFPIVFSGCGTGKDGKCKLKGSTLVLAPDGKEYAKVNNMSIFDNKPQPNLTLNVSQEYIKVIIEPSDKLGTYKVKVRVRDVVKKIDINLQRSFQVVDKNVPIETKKDNSEAKPIEKIEPNKKDIEVGKWMTYAYKEDNKKDMENIKYMMSSKAFTQKRSTMFPIAIFISKRFQQDDEYLNSIDINFDSLNNKSLFMLLVALKQADTKNSKALYDKLLLKTTDSKVLNYMKSLPVLDFSTIEVNSPAILDMLWASFMATGNTLYVKRIIDVLGKKDTKESINNIVLKGSAKWSILSNAKQHTKVLKVCKKHSKSSNLTLKKEIIKILEKVDEK